MPQPVKSFKSEPPMPSAQELHDYHSSESSPPPKKSLPGFIFVPSFCFGGDLGQGEGIFGGGDRIFFEVFKDLEKNSSKSRPPNISPFPPPSSLGSCKPVPRVPPQLYLWLKTNTPDLVAKSLEAADADQAAAKALANRFRGSIGPPPRRPPFPTRGGGGLGFGVVDRPRGRGYKSKRHWSLAL